jgi:hypothetical protein
MRPRTTSTRSVSRSGVAVTYLHVDAAVDRQPSVLDKLITGHQEMLDHVEIWLARLQQLAYGTRTEVGDLSVP